MLDGDYVDRYIREKCPYAEGWTDAARLEYKRWLFSDEFLDACLSYIYRISFRLEGDEEP